MYEAQLERDWRYIVTDSDSKMVISANNTIHKVVAQYVGKVSTCKCYGVKGRVCCSSDLI